DAYLSFNIPFDQTITLPVSEAFKKAFDREKTLKVVKPKFDLIAKKTKDLRRLGDRLEMAIKFVRDATPLNVKELSLLEAVSAVTNEMVEEKRNDPSSLQQTANARMDTFRNQIEAFKAPAYRDLVFRPRAFLRDPKLLDDRDTFPAEVLKLFDDPELKDAVKAASKHPQLIEPKVWNEFMLALTQVAQVMCTTPPDASGRDFATEFIDKHVIPMLHEFTRHDVPGLDKILAKCTDAELKKVIESDWVKLLPKGSGDSILAIIATAASVFLAAGTNLEGPHSLAIACYSAAIPTLLERSAAKIGSGKHVSGAIWRFLARLGNFTQQERIALMEALQDKDLKALRLTIRETLVDSMLKGTAVRACAALAAVAVLAMVVSTDAELSL